MMGLRIVKLTSSGKGRNGKKRHKEDGHDRLFHGPNVARLGRLRQWVQAHPREKSNVRVITRDENAYKGRRGAAVVAAPPLASGGAMVMVVPMVAVMVSGSERGTGENDEK